ncbi:hypothetical protein Plhal304r1_c025g0085031 [Plasmopara halstedii]
MQVIELERSAYSFYVCNGPDHEMSDKPAGDILESIRRARLAATLSLILLMDCPD